MKHRVALVLSAVLLGSACSIARAQEEADPAFDPRVPKPAYTARHPVIRIDEAHHNSATMGGRYRPLADLLGRDGCTVTPGVMPFSLASLDSCDVLVIADALGSANLTDTRAGFAAFTEAECDTVRDWVRAGGALLLVADASPFAAANDVLAKRFDIDMGKGYTGDTRHMDPSIGNAGCILFTREDKTLVDHPITRGRAKEERLTKVGTFTGQSLKGPARSSAFLVLQKSAVDLPLSMGGKRINVPQRQPDGQMITLDRVPAEGRAQGVAFEYGKGRVVVLGEATMLSAQLIPSPRDPSHQAKVQLGMGRPDLDNRQLALNIVHWLTRDLK